MDYERLARTVNVDRVLFISKIKTGGQDMTEWEKQESLSDIWIPTEEGEELIGEVTDSYEGGYGQQYTIKKEDGSEVRTPSHKVLQNRMAKVEKGNKVKIVYTGEEPPTVKGQNPTRMYDVFVAK